jgi:hypothetical protein
MVSKVPKLISNEMKAFGERLFDRKRKGGIAELTSSDINHLPGEQVSDELSSSNQIGIKQLKKDDKDKLENKDELLIKLDWVRLRK